MGHLVTRPVVLVMLVGLGTMCIGAVAVTSWSCAKAYGPTSDNTDGASSGAGDRAGVPAARLAPDREAMAEECRRQAETWRILLDDHCAVISRAPFVIAGDLPETELVQWHERTIGPAARAMGHAYFQNPPDRPVTVLLFDGQENYSRYAAELFGDQDVSVYGYYKPRERVLVMNISTGGGTLVHELTHALIAFDFPNVPDWFNEGLASLHEQCRIRSDETGIDGLENWRLPGLQTAIQDGKLGPLVELMERNDFRGRGVGLNYAQARYLCLYLQRKDKLEAVYQAFRESSDNTGVASIKAILGDEAWQSLDADFQDWVLSLEFGTGDE